MNRIFRIVWSHARNAWIVGSELARGRTKSTSTRRRLAALVSATLLLAALPAAAADLYWDRNLGTAGRGGTDSWNTTSTFWTTNANGTTGPFVAWSNGALDNAIFGGTVGSVTLTQPITVQNVTFEIGGYNITGNTLTLGGVTPTIYFTGGFSNTISSVLAGTSGLTLSGFNNASILNLSAVNTLTGGITINTGRLVTANNANNILNGANNVVTINNGGILQIGNSNAFGGNTAAANLVMNDGSRLLLNNAHLTHNITTNGGTIVIQDDVCCSFTSIWTGALTLNANTTLLVDNTGGFSSSATTFAGSLADTGANLLTVTLNATSGRLNLSGNNSFTGGINVNTGVLDLMGANSAGAATNIATVNSGGTLRVSHASAFANTSASNLILNNGGRFMVSGVTSAHDVQLSGTTGIVDGTGNGIWSGTAVLAGGNATLTLGDTGSFGGAGTLNTSTSLTTTGNLFDNGAVLSVRTGFGDIHFSGALNFSGDLTIGGNSHAWFNPAGTFAHTGSTIIADNGRMWLNSATPFAPTSNIRFEGNTSTGVTVVGLTTNHQNFTLPVGAGGTEIRWNGSGGFYARQNQSDATVNLFNDLRTLTWGAGGTPGFVPDGSMLILGTDGSFSSARTLNFRNGIDLNGLLRSVRADNGTVDDHAIISGQLTGTGGLRLLGSGALELNNNTNNYTGATVVGDGATGDWGNLILGNSTALPMTSNLQLNGSLDGEVMGRGGVAILTAASGDFTRALGAGGDQVRWITSGGFAALDGVRTVNIGGAGVPQTLTWGAADFVPTGQALRFGSTLWPSNGTLNFVNPIDLGAVDRVINVIENSSAQTNATAEVRLSGVIEGTGGLSLRGIGDVQLNAENTFTGALTIGAASATGNDDGMFVYAPTIADAGVASSIGAGNGVVLSSAGGALVYTGATTSTNRSLSLRDGNVSLGLRNNGTGSLTWAGNITSSLGPTFNTNTLALGGTYNGGVANGVAINPNVLSGVISDGAAAARVKVAGAGSGNCAGAWRLTGANTFTGGLATESCTFEVTSLPNAGLASSVGASTSADTNLDMFYGGTLRYVGAGDTTDRLLRIGNTSYSGASASRLESSGTGALVFTNTGEIATYAITTLSHFLGGTNTANNSFAPTLVDGPTPVDRSSSFFTLGKDGPGLWALPTNNNNQPDAYTGNTRIQGGALRLDHAGAITGGLGVSSSHGATGSAQRSSLIQFEGSSVTGTPTVLGLTAASGSFLRGTTSAGSAFVSNNNTFSNFDDDTYTQAVRWSNSGGFAAWDGVQIVNLFGDQRQVTWNADGFVPTNQNLVFGYSTATGTVDFRNPIALGNAQRTFDVYRGLAATDAILSNVLSGTAGGGIIKNGNGILVLTADNTFTGNTNVNAGTLQLGDGGVAGSGSLGASPTVGVSAGATLAINHSDAHTLNHAINGDGTLRQSGAGTTTMAVASDIDHIVIDAARLVTAANVITEDITFGAAGGTTLEVASGALNRTGNTAALLIGSALTDTVTVNAGASATISGSLGDGMDVLDVAGTLSTAGGTFALGLGDDTFTIHDGTIVTGSVDGGDGADTFNTAISTVASLGAAQGFETLAKTGVGTLNITGPASSTFDTVNVLEGTLAVNALGVVNPNATTVAAGATLSVAGAYGGTAGNDTMMVSGTLSGAGTINLQGGDDLLTVNDGASLGAFGGTFDGGAATTIDAVVVNNAAALTFAAGSLTGFEQLTKQNTGTATLTGNVAFTSGTVVNGGTLAVAGALETPTLTLADDAILEVSGTAQNAGATAVAITGTAGANTVRVLAGGDLSATGGLGDGIDTLDIAGTLDIGGGTFDLGAGDDTFVVHGGTNVLGTVIGGAGNDTRVYDLTGTANLGALQQFEGITKRNSGTLNINGPAMTDLIDVTVEGGTLNFAGDVTGLQSASVASGAILNVDGDMLFTAGDDVFTVGGTVNGAGVISLLGGNDNLIVQNDAQLEALANTIDGGTGTDTLTADITGTATLGGAASFEQLVKSNGGTLSVNGPALSDFVSVAVTGGSLNVGVAGAITGVENSSVSTGATLQVDGMFGGGAGNDTMTVSGTVRGSGTINLAGGDDVLTLNDGADLLGLLAPIDGGAQTVGDTLALNNAADMAIDASWAPTGFELLTKQNTGTATLSGTFAFSGGTVVSGGTLLVEDLLETPTLALGDDATLDVSGAMQDSGAAPITFTGSAGANTVRIAAAGTLVADGGLGGGADMLDVAGTLELGGGSFDLGAGDDTFIVYDGTNVTGTVIGGAGLDSRVFDLVGTASLGVLQQFEGLTKRNTGTLSIDGPGISTDLLDVRVEGGTLDVGAAGGIAGVQVAAVASGATLNVDGDFLFTSGTDTFDVGGAVSGLGSIDLLGGDDLLIVRDGADLSGLASALEGGTGTDTLSADVATTATLGGATGFENLTKQGAGSLRIVGPAGSQFDTVLVQAGVLEVTAGTVVDPQTTAVSAGATLRVDGTYTGTAGADTFTLSGALAGAGAVDLLADDDVLTINTGATLQFSGSFDAGAGADRLVLGGTGEQTFDLGRVGTTFRNFESFAKHDGGTWRLTGTAAGDWTVADGTLIGNSTNFSGNIDNAGTVVFDQGANGTFAGVLSGNGTLLKQGVGTLVMTGISTFSGETEVSAGTLQVDGTLPGVMTITGNGTLSGIGTAGAVTALSGANVAPGNPASPFGRLTIAGNYAGGGSVSINTVLGNEASSTSRLLILGNTSNTSAVVVNNIGGGGDRTAGDGIEIIQVDGTSPVDSFRLSQPVQAGAYEYFLHQGGAADTNDWYLRSTYTGPDTGPDPGAGPEPAPAFRPGVAGYVLGHQASLEFGYSALGNLRSRVGNQGRALDAEPGDWGDAWIRLHAEELDMGGARFGMQDMQLTMLQFGTDLYRSEASKGDSRFGLLATMGEGRATFIDGERELAGLGLVAGEVEMDFKGAGMYWTSHRERGGYLDVTGQLVHYQNEYRDLHLAGGEQKGWGGTVSAELGAAYSLGNSGWKAEPSIQIVYQQLELDGFQDGISSVSAVDEDALRTRAGVQLFRTAGDWLGMSNASPYVALGVEQDVLDPESVSIGATAITEELPSTTVDLGAGFMGQVKAGFQLHFDLRYQRAIEGEKDGVRANFGFRKQF